MVAEHHVTKDALTLQQLLLLNLGGDLEDISTVTEDAANAGDSDDDSLRATPIRRRSQLSSRRNRDHQDQPPFVFDRSHCTALIRLTEDDLFISQETWSSLQTMLRIFKMYDFPFLESSSSNARRVVGRRVAFSSYGAVLNSGDDYYAIGHEREFNKPEGGLVNIETTIGNENQALSDMYISPLTVLEWQRNIIANRLASSGAEWSEIYAKFNSGTYNNQNMVLDYHLVKQYFAAKQAAAAAAATGAATGAATAAAAAGNIAPTTALPSNTLLVVEQVPGHIVVNDMSERLSVRGYFGSYNIAFDPFIRKISGLDDDERAYGTGLQTHTRAFLVWFVEMCMCVLSIFLPR